MGCGVWVDGPACWAIVGLSELWRHWADALRRSLVRLVRIHSWGRRKVLPPRRRQVVFGDFKTELLPSLMGRVFHVTLTSTVDKIVVAGGIIPRGLNSEKGAFGHYESACAALGCVSVFDLRTVNVEEAERRLLGCAPWDGIRHDRGYSLFFLTRRGWTRLIPWTTFRDGEDTKVLMYCWHTEAGYPGTIALADIDCILDIEVPEPKWDPNSLADLHLRAIVEAKRKNETTEQ